MDSGVRTVTKYTVFCTTEGKWVESGYLKSAPTTCPNNNSHTISTVTEVDEISTRETIIKDDDSGTQGYWRTENFDFEVTGGVDTVTEYVVDHPFPVKIYNMVTMPTSENVNDYIEVTAADDTDIGLISGYPSAGVTTADASIGSTVIAIDDVALAGVKLGFRIKLKNGGTEEIVGECIAIDTSAKTITVSSATTQEFLAGSKVLITIIRFKKFRMSNDQNIVFGEGKVGGTLLAKGAKCHIRYFNKSVSTKRFNGVYEIDY